MALWAGFSLNRGTANRYSTGHLAAKARNLSRPARGLATSAFAPHFLSRRRDLVTLLPDSDSAATALVVRDPTLRGGCHGSVEDAIGTERCATKLAAAILHWLCSCAGAALAPVDAWAKHARLRTRCNAAQAEAADPKALARINHNRLRRATAQRRCAVSRRPAQNPNRARWQSDGRWGSESATRPSHETCVNVSLSNALRLILRRSRSRVSRRQRRAVDHNERGGE